MIDLKDIIKLYDSFAWIPTIRGALSLELIENSKNILGDVDKYVVHFKKYNGVKSEHYIVVTSLLTVNDSKFGSDYARTFRYIFLASINNSDRISDFLRTYNINNPEVERYFRDEGVLFGKLIIISELTDNLTNTEVLLLQSIKNLVLQKEVFNNEFYIKASSMEILETKRNLMFQQWLEIESLVTDIENANDNRPTYCFDVFLTRDGILLMRDATIEKYKKSYVSDGISNDYKSSIPLHRLFKVAMNYVKYLFHSNYYHNEEHDTYLPVSNVHPCLILGDNDLRRIFRHQLNAFLTPIMKLKRCKFRDYSIDANGIFIYAKSFINVFKYNSLVETEYIDKAEKFIDIQESEINYLLEPKKNILNTNMAQYNIIFIITGILAFVVAVLSIVSTFVEIVKIDFNKSITEQKKLLIIYLAFTLLIFFIGYILYIIPRKIAFRDKFARKRQCWKFLLKNSDLKKSKISFYYRCYVKLREIKLMTNIKLKNYIVMIINILLFFSAITLVYYILRINGI